MSETRSAAERRVINAARQIERASQYGASTKGAVAEYEAARADQRTARQEDAA
jgi:hypothetical protein